MKKFIKNHYILLHCFLIPLFFIVHNWLDFYLLINVQAMKWELLFWILLPFALLLISYRVFKNIFKAALFTSVLLIILFFGSSFISFAKSTGVLAYLGKYSAFLTVTCFLLALLFIWLRKTGKQSLRFHQFLFYCFFILLLYEPVNWFTGGKEKITAKNRLTVPQSPVLKPVNIQDDSLPDIYYLLFDELASSHSYQMLIDYDNTGNDSLLTSLGFKVVQHSVSASNHTHTAMPAVFNMSYLPFEQGQKISFRDMHGLVHSINENPLIPFLEQNGYEIYNAGIFRLHNQKGLTKPDLWTLHSANDMITGQTLYRNIWNNSGWIIQSRLPGRQTAAAKLVSDTALINEALSIVQQTIADTTAKPKFLYAHFYLPHGPVRYDINGNVLQWKSFNEYKEKNKSVEPYRDQVKYTFQLIVKLCRQIQQQNKRPALIIVQGDHGIRNYDTIKFGKDYSFQPYSAFYFPDNKTVSDSLYTPNTFRIVLNHYFQQNLPMLKEKKYYLKLEKDGALFKR
jgi:hypothetical protein